MTPSAVAIGRVPPAALAQLGLAVVLLGASWPVTRMALLQGASPGWFAFGRAALSTVVATVALVAARRVRVPRRADMPSLLALGLLQLAGFFALAHLAVAWVPAGRTAILSNATLIWAVPITLVALREPIPRLRWIATGVSAAGVAVLVGPWTIDWTDARTVLGNGFLLGAALCWTVAMTVVRRWPPVSTMFVLLPWAFGIASLALLPLALLYGGDGARWTPGAVACLAAIGVVMGPLGTWCIVEATTALPLVLASVGFLAGPAVGLLISALWLHEPLTPSLVAGAALILSGAGLAAGSGRR